MLRVLAYHRVADTADDPSLDPALISVTPESFRRQMLHLKKSYAPVDLAHVLEAFLDHRALPRRAVHVTVDDAYRDFAEVAWPILREIGIPVTVFVPTAYPGAPEREFWWDRLRRLSTSAPNASWREGLSVAIGVGGARGPSHRDLRAALRRLPHDEIETLMASACREAGLEATPTGARPPVLDWDELRALGREGVCFGAHTRHHVALSYVDEERIRMEIRGSLDDLRRELGEGPRPLAYPYGIHSPAVAKVAQAEGCPLAFTCEDGLSQPGRTDPLRLHRTNITRRTSPPVFAVRMLPCVAGIDRWRHRGERARNRR